MLQYPLLTPFFPFPFFFVLCLFVRLFVCFSAEFKWKNRGCTRENPRPKKKRTAKLRGLLKFGNDKEFPYLITFQRVPLNMCQLRAFINVIIWQFQISFQFLIRVARAMVVHVCSTAEPIQICKLNFVEGDSVRPIIDCCGSLVALRTQDDLSGVTIRRTQLIKINHRKTNRSIKTNRC